MIRYLYIGGRLMPMQPDSFSVVSTGMSVTQEMSDGTLRVGFDSASVSADVVTAKFSLPYDTGKAEFIDGDCSADAMISHLKRVVGGGFRLSFSVRDDADGAVLCESMTVASSELSFSFGVDGVSVVLKGRCIS